MEFVEGEIVEHKLNKEWLMIINVKPGEDVVTCRSKNFQIIDFYEYELKKVKQTNR